MDETQIILNTSQMIKSIGLIDKFLILGEWGLVLFTIVFLVHWVKFLAMDLVYYLKLKSDTDYEWQRSFDYFDGEPRKNCRILSWNRSKVVIHVGETRQTVTLSNTTFYKMNCYMNSETKLEEIVTERVEKILKNKK